MSLRLEGRHRPPRLETTMAKHFSRLTPAEAERLALLAEECGECIQAIGKILRHGYGSTHPDEPSGPDNRMRLQREMGDVRAAMIMLCDAGDTDKADIHARADWKLIKVLRYMHHQPKRRAPPQPAESRKP